jgi:hypothetical protein
MKPAGISGKESEHLKGKINEIATNSKIKDIKNLYGGIN